MKEPMFSLLDGNLPTRSYLALMKWLALAFMAIYHFNHALRYAMPEWVYAVGSVVFPIFAFILGFNLASAVEKKDYAVEQRLMRYLFAFGCFAQPFYWSFVNGPLPLNILFTLALGVYLIFHYKTWQAWLALLVFGYFIEGFWFGGLLVLTSYLLCSDLMRERE